MTTTRPTTLPMLPTAQQHAAAFGAAKRDLHGAARDLVLRCAWWITQHGYPTIKRGTDILVSGTALVLALPLFAIVAAIIKLEDRGPIFFVQTRVGRFGRTFRFYKFRTMCTDAEKRRAELLSKSDDGNDVRFKMRRDPRITRIGRWLRRFSIDEAPQIWNVLIGDMTLVGPRPPIPEETAKYTVHQWRRLDVTPGLTCSWQVSGRADIPFPEQVELDIDYIQQRSVVRDVRLMIQTIPAVLVGRGAY